MSDIYGLDISKHDNTFLLKSVEKRVYATEMKTASDYVVFLSKNEKEARDFYDLLYNTYTEFFRDSLTFAQLEQWILPRLVENKSIQGELRIWSAGCSSGQEAYSLAILLERFQKTHRKQFRYRIIATDISEPELDAARNGIYSRDAVSNIRTNELKECFMQSGDLYTVCPRLKTHVHFSHYDLLDSLSACPKESIYGDFDLIFCSNVLFYYKPEAQSLIINKLVGAMASSGYLVTGEAESHFVEKHNELHPVAPHSSIFQKRS